MGAGGAWGACGRGSRGDACAEPWRGRHRLAQSGHRIAGRAARTPASSIADGLPTDGEMSVDLAREGDFRLGPLLVRPSRREAGEGAERRTLEPRVMQALVVLAGQPDEVVSRDEL